MSQVLSERRSAPIPNLARILIESGDLFFDWDLSDNKISWTGEPEAVLGLADLQLRDKGERFLARIHPEDLPRRMILLTDAANTRESVDCQYRIRGDNGEFHWVRERSIPRLAPDGSVGGLSGVISNVDKWKESEERLRFLSTHDELTGHYNRLRLREALEGVIEDSICGGYQAGFLLVSVDKLAQIEQVYGEDTANNVLLAAADRLARILRSGDIVGRVGYDRFAIIIKRCADGQLHSVVGRVLAAVRETVARTQSGPLHITASAGATVFPTSARTAADVVSQAEGALLGALRLGSDSFAEFRDLPAHVVMTKHHFTVAEQVQQALHDDRIVLAYQPIVDASTSETVFYEGLARLLDENGERVPAGQFVPVVEQMGLMRLIDRKVLDLGFAALEQNPELCLSINVSGLTAVDPVWLAQLSERLSGRSHVARRLTLEITETVALDDIDESSRFVRTLASLGCRVALDDFGAGFTSFRHLRALRVDMVKIDGSFVRDLLDSPDNQVFVRTLVSLAKGIDLLAVAECVETEAEAEFLRAQGVDYLQGFYFGRPEISLPGIGTSAPPRLAHTA